MKDEEARLLPTKEVIEHVIGLALPGGPHLSTLQEITPISIAMMRTSPRGLLAIPPLVPNLGASFAEQSLDTLFFWA